MHWWPRQTPRIGVEGPSSRTRSVLIPASAGVHGPGEMTTPSGDMEATSARVMASLRCTTGDAPSSPRYCTRL